MRDERVKSAIRAFEILEYFDKIRGPLRLKDFCAAFGYPMSSAEELLKAMVHHGYLMFDPSRRSYLPSMRVASMCAWVPDMISRQGRLYQAMQEINDVTGEMVAVSGINDLHSEVIDMLPASVPDPSFQVNDYFYRCPMVASGVGCVWLSEESEDKVERIYRRSAARGLFNRKRLPLASVIAKVKSLRGQSIVTLDSFWLENASMICTVVSIAEQRQRIILSVSGPRQRMTGQQPVIRKLLSKWHTELGNSPLLEANPQAGLV